MIPLKAALSIYWL